MKIKRLISLMLCFVMLASAVFTTGCGESEKTGEEQEEKQNKTIALNMFIVTEDETTDEEARAVQFAINEITLKRFKTKIKINYIKEDEYWNTIEEAVREVEEYELAQKANKDAEASEEKAEEAENAENDEAETSEEEEFTLDDELDMIIHDGDIVLDKPQVDIIVFNNYERFREFAANKKLAPIDEYLSLDSKILKSYIYPTFLEAAKIGTSSTYGVPVNGPIGSYEYFVFDKELANKYGFNVKSVKTFADLEAYLAIIKANEPGVVPLDRATSPADYEFYASEGSPIGVFDKPGDNVWSEVVLSTYTQEEVLSHYRTINKFRKAGYLADENVSDDTRYAVQIREGTLESPKAWEEQDNRKYECVVYKTPKYTNDSIATGVFAISANSYNKAAAMQIIKAFNTNAQLANLLQWGIENVHYYVQDEDDGMGTITLVNDSGYYMDTGVTGNKYIKYRLESEPYEFEAYKEQNLNTKIGKMAGFNPTLDKEGEETLSNAYDIVAKYYPDLIGGYGDFDENITNLMEELNNVYSVGSWDTFISHKLAGSYYLFSIAMNDKYNSVAE